MALCHYIRNSKAQPLISFCFGTRIDRTWWKIGCVLTFIAFSFAGTILSALSTVDPDACVSSEKASILDVTFTIVAIFTASVAG